MANKEEREVSWGPVSEIKFINGLGTWQAKEHRIERTEREWLELYVKTHSGSKIPHYVAGVKHCQMRLQQLDSER